MKGLTKIAPYIIIIISIITTIIYPRVNAEASRIISVGAIIFSIILLGLIAYIDKPLEKKDKMMFICTLIIAVGGLIYTRI